MNHIEKRPTGRWEDVASLPEFSGNEALAEGMFRCGHSPTTIGKTLAVCGNPVRALIPASSPDYTPTYAAALASIARRAAIMRLPDAKARESLADKLATDGATIKIATATLAKAAASDGWRRAVDKINGERPAAIMPQQTAPDGWRRITDNINARNCQNG